jgi:hypothetical protein
MMKLKSHYRKNGYDYYLVARTETEAVYRQADGDRTVAYEVGHIKIQKEDTTMADGSVIPAGERFWSNEDIGRISWSYTNYERAGEKYRELTKA